MDSNYNLKLRDEIKRNLNQSAPKIRFGYGLDQNFDIMDNALYQIHELPEENPIYDQDILGQFNRKSSFFKNQSHEFPKPKNKHQAENSYQEIMFDVDSSILPKEEKENYESNDVCSSYFGIPKMNDLKIVTELNAERFNTQTRKMEKPITSKDIIDKNWKTEDLNGNKPDDNILMDVEDVDVAANNFYNQIFKPSRENTPAEKTTLTKKNVSSSPMPVSNSQIQIQPAFDNNVGGGPDMSQIVTPVKKRTEIIAPEYEFPIIDEIPQISTPTKKSRKSSNVISMKGHNPPLSEFDILFQTPPRKNDNISPRQSSKKQLPVSKKMSPKSFKKNNTDMVIYNSSDKSVKEVVKGSSKPKTKDEILEKLMNDERATRENQLVKYSSKKRKSEKELTKESDNVSPENSNKSTSSNSSMDLESTNSSNSSSNKSNNSSLKSSNRSNQQMVVHRDEKDYQQMIVSGKNIVPYKRPSIFPDDRDDKLSRSARSDRGEVGEEVKIGRTYKKPVIRKQKNETDTEYGLSRKSDTSEFEGSINETQRKSLLKNNRNKKQPPLATTSDKSFDLNDIYSDKQDESKYYERFSNPQILRFINEISSQEDIDFIKKIFKSKNVDASYAKNKDELIELYMMLFNDID